MNFIHFNMKIILFGD